MLTKCGFLAVLVLATATGGWCIGGFKGITLGEAVSSLPFPCNDHENISCEGAYQSAWVRVMVGEGKVEGIDVLYAGRTFERVEISAPPITLAQAVMVHSLQPGFSPPRFGYAIDIQGTTYGVVDIANQIVYSLAGPLQADSFVTRVSYLGPMAPVLVGASGALLGSDKDSALLNAAKAAAAYRGTVTVEDPEEDYKAFTHEEAVTKLNEQVDVVMGKGKMTLALIRDVMSWYELDKDHPDAIAKSQELRKFYPAFEDEWHKLLRIDEINKQLYKNDEDVILIPLDMEQDVESKMRQVKAMGFKLE